MGWLRKKKPDPISDRARALQAEIEQLEQQIHELSEQAGQSQPRLRSTTLPKRPAPAKPVAPEPPPEQVFETLDHQRLQMPPEEINKALYNELGVRKYDLPAAWRKFKSLFQGTEATHQPFVKYLAAGNIEGLRPLRYEKRIARRRFILFASVLFLALWVIFAVILRR